MSFFFEARKPGLFASLTIWGMADLRKPCVLPSTGLNKVFRLLVTVPLLFSVLTNQFLNFVLLIQSLVNFSNIFLHCSFIDDIFASRRAQENYRNISPYTRYRPVLRTDSIRFDSCPVISVLQAGVANWRTLNTLL